MNNSQFQSFELLALKNTAKTVNILVNKKNKLRSKIIELNKELDNIVDTIMKWEAPIKDRFGYSSEQLMDKIPVENTDKNGKVIKTFKYVFKYPDTIVPPTQNEQDSSDNGVEFPQSNTSIEVNNTDELKEVFEDYETQRIVEESKNPTTDLPFEE